MKNMKNMRSIFALLLVAVLMLSAVGCGKQAEQPTEPVVEPVYTYNTYLTLSPSNWNELTYQDNNDREIMSYIGSSFFGYDFKFDENGEILPGEFVVTYEAATNLEDVTAQYAEAWGLPADGKAQAYKITLREDLKWENGDPIKAEDFVYTMSEQLNPCSRTTVLTPSTLVLPSSLTLRTTSSRVRPAGTPQAASTPSTPMLWMRT